MPRELPGFRDQLEDILSFTNGNRILTKEEVQLYTGKSRNWCDKYLAVTKAGITAHVLARKLVSL